MVILQVFFDRVYMAKPLQPYGRALALLSAGGGEGLKI